MQHVVIAIIEDSAGRILSLKRAKGQEDGVVWGFPGGKIDAGESEEQAVVREVFEESGVECKVIKKIGERCYAHLTLHYFRCRMTGGKPRNPENKEASEVAFRSREELLKLIPPQKLYNLIRVELGIEESQGSLNDIDESCR